MTAGEDAQAWRGGRVGEVAECVLAPNPGPMTLDGTNTWVLAAAGQGEAAVVDPGPAHHGHLAAVLDAAARRDVRITSILLTHGHLDHSEGAARLRELTGAPVRALDRRHTLGAEGLRAGAVLQAGGLPVEVVATPGHTGDSLCFLLPDAGAVLTGDTVLGRGTTVVAHPDGQLDDYLASLRRLERLAGERDLQAVLPGHGPVLAAPLTPPVEVLGFYLRHRRERLEQVRAAVASGARTARDVVERVYLDVPRSVWPAAELSVRAQLAYLGVPADAGSNDAGSNDAGSTDPPAVSLGGNGE
jgi:glyoxylase-like metal-dependent hydrolase (beta-lactamase superfamily II)